jgi:DNA polymerase elongation subunit (family B)
MKYYTNVACVGNNILYRGVKNDRRVKLKVAYTPTLFLPSKKETAWKTLDGEFLEPMEFESIREARDFVKRYEDVENFKIFGNSSYQYAFIADEQKGMVDWKMEDLSIAIIDIEVGSENGFPDPYLANEPITAIAIKYINGAMTVFGCGDYKVQGDEVYIKCDDEYNLCKKFLRFWEENCPDAISGWNIKFFDIPYIVNRFNKILGEDETKKLSPWGYINSRKTVMNNRELVAYDFVGVSTLDYIELYRWYAPGGKSQESYSLNNICNVEIGESKISYEEFDNLHQLYKLNHQKFIEYNIKDVELVLKLEHKLKLIELGLTLAYDTKTNYEDIFAQTRMWDSLIYNYLFERNIIVPPKSHNSKSAAFEGAYVKEVQVGKHDWVASFDLTSLYPSLMMQYNMSPETLIEPADYTDEMHKILSAGVSVEKLLENRVNTSGLINVTLTPNGQFFRTDIKGFMPSLIELMFKQRQDAKKTMLKDKQQLELVLIELDKRNLRVE